MDWPEQALRRLRGCPFCWLCALLVVSGLGCLWSRASDSRNNRAGAKMIELILFGTLSCVLGFIAAKLVDHVSDRPQRRDHRADTPFT